MAKNDLLLIRSSLSLQRVSLFTAVVASLASSAVMSSEKRIPDRNDAILLAVRQVFSPEDIAFQFCGAIQDEASQKLML
jgi:hypothetical protein